MELPARAQVPVDVLLLGEPVEPAEQSRIRSTLVVADRLGADPGRQPLEPEPRRVDLLEVLARQAADERSPRLAHLDEPLAARAR